MCIFLSGANLPQIVAELRASYPPNTPVALVQKATWPQENIYRGTLGCMLDEIDAHDWQLSTLLLVGEVLDDTVVGESRLYAADYSHRFRNASRRISS
jgi:precorrin-4/cobalt-precorrin-4 C11-methyltransferase